MNLSLSALALWAAMAAQQASASQSVTLDQIMAAPFSSNVTAAPAKNRVAWVMNQAGVRNIWVAEGPRFEGRRLTRWIDDDGQTLSSLSWSKDADVLVFVRGDGPNSRGELPNPLHRPQGTERAVWMAPFAGGPAVQVAQGQSPLLTPSGEALIYVAQGKAWIIDLKRGQDDEKVKPKKLFQVRGGVGQMRFSPRGDRLAFVSRRGRNSYIGVYNWKARALEFLDPSLNSDSDPVWSPDGNRLAFLRIPPRRRVPIFEPAREAAPWSIRIHDFSQGRTRTLFVAEAGTGSAFRNVVASNQLFWVDGQVVFPWEKDGWTHLYAVPEGGGVARLLTPGEFEVENVALTQDGRAVVYSSNQDDINARHLWSVTPQGSPRRLTSGSANQWSPAPLSQNGLTALIQADARRPGLPYLRWKDGRLTALAPDALPDDYPFRQLVEPRPVVFSAADGMRIHGQLFLPRNSPAGSRHPAMLYFHGGSRRQMLPGWHYSNYYHNCYAFNQYLANQGYVVLSVNYRSGIGYGMKFREALDYGASGASEFNDVLGAGLYLQSRDDVDPARIGLWGGSYGGYLTALGLSRASDLFAAGVDLHGVHDWNIVIRNFVPSYNALEVPEQARLAFDSSPMASIDGWRSPVLLIHGDDDRNVPFSESIDLAEALGRRGVEFESLVFPDEVHGFLLHRSWMAAFRRAADFLQRKLGGGHSAPAGR